MNERLDIHSYDKAPPEPPARLPFDWYAFREGLRASGAFLRDICIGLAALGLGYVAVMYAEGLNLQNFVNKLFIMSMGIALP